LAHEHVALVLLQRAETVVSVRAHIARPDRDPEIAALIPLTALAAAAVEAPSEVALPLFVRAIETARNQAELVAALEGPTKRRASGALKAALVKLRDTPYKIDAKVEALLGRIADMDSVDALDFELDGENPFRDR